MIWKVSQLFVFSIWQPWEHIFFVLQRCYNLFSRSPSLTSLFVFWRLNAFLRMFLLLQKAKRDPLSIFMANFGMRHGGLGQGKSAGCSIKNFLSVMMWMSRKPLTQSVVKRKRCSKNQQIKGSFFQKLDIDENSKLDMFTLVDLLGSLSFKKSHDFEEVLSLSWLQKEIWLLENSPQVVWMFT